jgi:hypothetical protein
MKISSDWIVYYIRSFNLYDNPSNVPIGRAVKQVLTEMGCIEDPAVIQIKSPVVRAMKKEFGESEFAKVGCVYDLSIDRLTEFFKELSIKLGIEIK